MQIFDRFIYGVPLQAEMKKWLIELALLLFLLSLSGCSPSANEIVEEWQNEGWKIEKIHGQQGAIDRHGKLMSEQAQAIEASWIENGKRKTKLYPQVNYRFVVLRFFKKDADEFVVVMKKRK